MPPPPPGLVDRRVEITGPTEPKMAINALNCGRERLAGRPRGRQHPALAQRRRRAGGAAGRRPPDAVVHRPPTARSTGCARTASCPRSCRAPRGWHLPERHLLVDGEPDRRRAGRRRPLPLPQRAGAARPRQRPVLLPAQDGGPPRGAALGAGVRPRRAGARPPGRLDPRHDAHRDHPGRVRDGGDAARAGRPRRRRSTPAAGTTCSA